MSNRSVIKSEEDFKNSTDDLIDFKLKLDSLTYELDKLLYSNKALSTNSKLELDMLNINNVLIDNFDIMYSLLFKGRELNKPQFLFFTSTTVENLQQFVELFRLKPYLIKWFNSNFEWKLQEFGSEETNVSLTDLLPQKLITKLEDVNSLKLPNSLSIQQLSLLLLKHTNNFHRFLTKTSSRTYFQLGFRIYSYVLVSEHVLLSKADLFTLNQVYSYYAIDLNFLNFLKSIPTKYPKQTFTLEVLGLDDENTMCTSTENPEPVPNFTESYKKLNRKFLISEQLAYRQDLSMKQILNLFQEAYPNNSVQELYDKVTNLISRQQTKGFAPRNYLQINKYALLEVLLLNNSIYEQLINTPLQHDLKALLKIGEILLNTETLTETTLYNLVSILTYVKENFQFSEVNSYNNSQFVANYESNLPVIHNKISELLQLNN